MSDSSSTLERLWSLVTLPVRLVWRALGTFVAVCLLALVPVVVVSALTMAWFGPLAVAAATVGVPSAGPVGAVRVLGLPTTVAGVPTAYPLALGALSALVLGWPNPDYEGDLSDHLFRLP